MVILKVTFSAATIAVVALWETGEAAVAAALIPSLFMLWYATRLRARRRVRDGDRA